MSAGSFAVGSESVERAGASARMLAATAVLSGFAAGALPGNRLGLGAVLVAGGVTALVAWARATPWRPETIAYAALALGLASMFAVRSAGWVVALDGLAAAGLAALAVAGGGTWEEVRRAPLVVASRAAEAVPYVARGASRLTAGRRFSPALRGMAVGAALVAVFGGLFISADRAFAELARDVLLPDIDVALLPARVAVFVGVAVAATALVIAGPRFAHLGPPRLLVAMRGAMFQEGEGGERRRWSGLAPIEWMVALGLLDLLFVAFVVVQVAVLFAGHDHVLRTAGLTYAEYAREGFFQLLVAAALTLAVVAGASRWAGPRGDRHRRILEVLLGLLLLLTLVVLASALKRLLLYEEAFGFTRLRISVHAVILWLAGVLVMVMAAGAFRRGRWLPRAVVGFSAAALLVFNLMNPDALVASRNVERYEEIGRVDLPYLAGLSADAVPSLLGLPRRLPACAFLPHRELFTEPDPWPGWNLARARAVQEESGDIQCSR
ncbi:MAG: DUF4173 domain-containing protein [Actinomycetota bacterium]